MELYQSLTMKLKIGTAIFSDYSFFFIANRITDESKQKAILLSSCGTATYKIFKGLTVPAKPGEKSFSELTALMRKH